MLDTTTCKPLDGKLTREEQWVLKVLRNKPIMVAPKDYYVKIIEAIHCAIMGDTETMAYATQLAKIHPALCNAVNCLVNGNLEARYMHQKPYRSPAEIVKEMGYK